MYNVFKSRSADPVWGICMFTRIESYRTETLQRYEPVGGAQTPVPVSSWQAAWSEAGQGAGVSLSHEAPLHQGSHGDWLTWWSWASSKRLEEPSLNLLLTLWSGGSGRRPFHFLARLFTVRCENQVFLAGDILLIFSSLLFFPKKLEIWVLCEIFWFLYAGN